jgi:acetyl-CoA carboxylase biotin carboxyl carrier protein
LLSRGFYTKTIAMSDQKDHQATKAKREQGHETPGSGERRRPNRKRSRKGALVDLDELRGLIALLRENGLTEFELEREGFRIHLRQGIDYQSGDTGLTDANLVSGDVPPASKSVSTFAASGVTAAPAHPGASAETAASEDQDLHIITSPIVGTFYRSPSPNAESFVKIGSQVGPETVVCIIEAMKLMNEIPAETSGEVVKIYVENGQPVEYGQPLFGIKK